MSRRAINRVFIDSTLINYSNSFMRKVKTRSLTGNGSLNWRNSCLVFLVILSLKIVWKQCEWELRRDRWREAVAWSEAAVKRKDVIIIKSLIRKKLIMSRRHEHPIMVIQRISQDVLHITVGWLADPLMGQGTKLELRRLNGGWTVESLGGWIC